MTLQSKREDKAMDYAFYTEPTFLEKCLKCEFMEYDKDVRDMLCGADKFRTCQSIEIECIQEGIECQMIKEIR